MERLGFKYDKTVLIFFHYPNVYIQITLSIERHNHFHAPDSTADC